MSGQSKRSKLTILAIVLLLGFGVLQVGVKLASRDIPPPDESFFKVERLKVASEDNAYTYFLQATNHLYVPEEYSLLGNYLARKPVDETEINILLERNTDCISLVKKGVGCTVCQTPELNRFEDAVPYINSWIQMGRVLAAQTRQKYLADHLEEAIPFCLINVQYGYLIQQDAGSLINYLVGVAIENMALEQALELGTAGRATEQDLELFAEGLNRLGSFDKGLVLAFKAEARIMMKSIGQLSHGDGEYDLIDMMTFGAAEESHWSWLSRRFQRSRYWLKPNQTKQNFIHFFKEIIRDIPLAYSEGNQADISKFGSVWTDWVRPNAIGRFLVACSAPSNKHILRTRCRIESLLSGTRLAVACNRFERQKGRWPERLQELVPEFLDAVPMDPFDGEPFRYSAEKGIVYSVGENCTDEGGSMRVEGSEDEVAVCQNRRKAEDLVYEIHPATKPDEQR